MILYLNLYGNNLYYNVNKLIKKNYFQSFKYKKDINMATYGQSLTKLFMRYKNSSYDQFSSIYKSPINPKIILYGQYNKLLADVLKK